MYLFLLQDRLEQECSISPKQHLQKSNHLYGFHYHNLLSGVFDGSVSEGLADSIAFLQTGDAKISPYFYVSGGHIREVSNNRSYPEDIVNEVHIDGLIFAGAVWDLWNILVQDDPEEGTNTLTHLLVEATSMGPEIATSYEAFLFADDDDGDLSNGIPLERSPSSSSANKNAS